MTTIPMLHRKAPSGPVPPLTVAWATIALSCIAVFFGNLRFGREVLAVGFEDDFFYYAQVARNLASHGTSTFDGIHLTNGYHPLWLLLLTLVTKLFGQPGLLHAASVIPFAFALELLQCTLVAAIAYFTMRLCQPLCSNTVCACILLLQASFAIVLVRTGMEVGLTLTMGFALLSFRLNPGFSWSPSSSFRYGLLASLCVLSRLDSSLFVGLLVLCELVPNVMKKRALVKACLFFFCGTLPVILYLAINLAIFGAATPVSGMAKQMRFHHAPSLVAFQSFLGFLTASGSPLLAPLVLVTALAFGLLVAKRIPAPSGTSGIYGAVLAFPFLHLLTIIILSDWKLWPWYLYPWLLSGTIAVALLFHEKEPAQAVTTRVQQAGFVLCSVFLLAYAGLVAVRSSPAHNLTYAVGLEVRHFAQDHPGLYAMGDRSGAVGYLIGQPLLQMEGLTMDKAYLANIRQQRDLETVLEQYGVRYYISTRSVRDADGCYAVKEPWQAGPDSPAMRGRVCKVPVATFTHGPFINHLFDMQSSSFEANRPIR